MNMIPFGEIITDLAPGEEARNPRNSEGAFLKLKNGNLFFVYSRFRGESAADFATSDLYQITFDPQMHPVGQGMVCGCEQEDAMNIMSVSLLRMQNGDIGLFYLVRKNRSDLKMYVRRSNDEGVTWGERTLCTAGEDVFVVNNDRVLRLSDGRILIPAAAHPVTETGYCEFAKMTFFYSDDDAKTWKQSPDAVTMPAHYRNCNSGLQEPGVIELQAGKLMAWARTDIGMQYASFSEDYGLHWSLCEPTVFTAPNSPLSMKRMPDGTLLAIWNPIPQYNGRAKISDYFLGGRCPLAIAFSSDNGETFTEPTAIETDQSRGYCYCSIFFTEDDLLLAYCAGGIEDKSCLARLRIRRVPLREVIMLKERL